MLQQHPPKSRGFTLLEILIVMVIIGVLAGLMVQNTSAGSASQLRAAASILAGEIEYARNLAVLNSDNYKITFDLANNRWTLTHSGTNTALDALPVNAFHTAAELSTQQVVNLAALPSLGSSVRLYAVWAVSNSTQDVSDIEFLPVGGTTRSQATQIWLATGTAANTRYISVYVHPVTGLYWIDNFQSTPPMPFNFSGS